MGEGTGADPGARGRVRTEPSNRRVRVFVGGVCIVDTDDALYVWESPFYPQYYLPRADFVDGVLTATATITRSPSRGPASHFTVRAGGSELVDAAWSHTDSPIEELRGRVRLEWDAMDAWFEEDEEVFVHPRDPSTRIQILPSSRHVTVAVDGVLIADSHRPVFLFETGIARRTYFSKLDVRMDLLSATATTSQCPYKGTANYWSVRVNDEMHEDLVWSYHAPTREAAPIADLVAFYDEHVDVTVDGVLQARPGTRGR